MVSWIEWQLISVNFCHDIWRAIAKFSFLNNHQFIDLYVKHVHVENNKDIIHVLHVIYSFKVRQLS